MSANDTLHSSSNQCSIVQLKRSYKKFHVSVIKISPRSVILHVARLSLECQVKSKEHRSSFAILRCSLLTGRKNGRNGRQIGRVARILENERADITKNDRKASVRTPANVESRFTYAA